MNRGDGPLSVEEHNRRAWTQRVREKDVWTLPVSAEEVAAARRGQWSVLLTPLRPVPREWFGELEGKRVLALASGGGQQGPILAAAGAQVTVVDVTPAQLAQDAFVAARDGLDIELIACPMDDLSDIADESFDLVFHPVANLFVEDCRLVWAECHRVLRRGGTLLAGFANPLLFLIDEDIAPGQNLVIRHPLPYSDLLARTDEERAERFERGEPLEFGHTLEDQIAGQLEVGFQITGFFEDRGAKHPIDDFAATFLATRAVKT